MLCIYCLHVIHKKYEQHSVILYLLLVLRSGFGRKAHLYSSKGHEGGKELFIDVVDQSGHVLTATFPLTIQVTGMYITLFMHDLMSLFTLLGKYMQIMDILYRDRHLQL